MRRAPRFVKTAITSAVSTRTSRSAVAPTRGVGRWRRVLRGRGLGGRGAGLMCARSVRRLHSVMAPRMAPASTPAQTATDTCTAPGTTGRWRGERVFPFIFGRPGRGCCGYRAGPRDFGDALKTRRPAWGRVQTAGAKRMTPGEPSRGEPRAARHAVLNHGLPGEVRTRRHEPAGTREIRRNEQLVPSKQRQGDENAHSPGFSRTSPAGEGCVQGCDGIRLQGQSGWRRAAPASARRRRRSRQRYCCDGKPLESVV